MITPQPAQPSRIDYIHPDHLGTPRLVTNASQTIIWRWDSSPFGATDTQQDPDGDSQAFVLNLRFPGQYFDDETGLHYNYFRDYDPTLGRYIESDPIGLEGGINTYAYVGGNPISFTDPLGLRPCPPGMSSSENCWIDDGDGNGSGHPNEGRCADPNCLIGKPPNPPTKSCPLKCEVAFVPVCGAVNSKAPFPYNIGSWAGCAIVRTLVCEEVCEDDCKK